MFSTAPAWAWNGVASADPTFIEEDGVYLIGSPEQLAGFREWVNAGNSFDATYRLSQDIDLTINDSENSGEKASWVPIGDSIAHAFSGVLSGDGYTVSHLNIHGTMNIDYAGLFGVVSGDIYDLGVTDFVIDITRTSDNDVYAGGVVGLLQNGSIRNSYATGNLEASVSSDANHYLYAGGLVGGAKSTSWLTSCRGMNSSPLRVGIFRRGLSTSSSSRPMDHGSASRSR